MKAKITILVFVTFLTNHAFAQSVYSASAQASFDKSILKLTKTPVGYKVDSLREIATVGYYAKLILSKNSLASGHQYKLRTTNTCNSSFCSSAALPVMLIRFLGSRLDENRVQLTWETSSETNNAGFEIERSLEMSAGFQKVGFVDGKGDQSTKSKYGFVDQNGFPQVSYYRLKQIDFDGFSSYSRVIAMEASKSELKVIAYPNPGQLLDTKFKILGIDPQRPVSVRIYDTNGKILYQTANQLLNKDGIFSVSQILHLPTGIYVLKVFSDDHSATVHFVDK